MQKLWMIFVIFYFSTSHASDDVFITIGSDALDSTQKTMKTVKILKTNGTIAMMKINKADIENLSAHMHEKFNRCGGFILHESEEEANKVFQADFLRLKAKSVNILNYSITEEQTVKSMLTQVKENNIREMIKKLSNFQNRYYKSKTGVESQQYVKKTWMDLAETRSDIRVEEYQHTRWPQPSIILTIEGTSKKNEIVIIGGHGDSISGFWGREKARAPGADDNASGISTITEIIRVIVDSGYIPQRTIKFMSYAAEEVGLLGSGEIANDYKKQGKNIIGVVQFDMTNFKGSKNLDIVFMNDYTNTAQNSFMGSLIDQYLTDVSWGYSRCGYGCSDHASWHNAGYPASMPFESTMGDMNGHIHTARDIIDVSGSYGTADHAEKFARLGIAFLVEMGK